MRMFPIGAARTRLYLPLVVAFGLVAVACGSASNQAQPTSTSSSTSSSTSTSTSTSTTASTSTTTVTTAPPARTTVLAYFLRDEKVAPVAREAVGVATAAAAIDALLAGPTPAEQAIGLSSTVPAGTSRLGLTIHDRIATVDLSREFESGGGSASMQGRVAQVVFTLTQFPAVDAVTFWVDGRPLTVLGGEGLLLDKPQRRSDWEDFAPAILVESPLPFAEVTSPMRLKGTANTFEATFHVRLTDARGRVVYDHYATATSGTGFRGTFEITIPFGARHAGNASLRVYESSAEDGRPIHVVEFPVNLRG
jgi:spore germination protein GerM